jgi:hypothetical protein
VRFPLPYGAAFACTVSNDNLFAIAKPATIAGVARAGVSLDLCGKLELLGLPAGNLVAALLQAT